MAPGVGWRANVLRRAAAVHRARCVRVAAHLRARGRSHAAARVDAAAAAALRAAAAAGALARADQAVVGVHGAAAVPGTPWVDAAPAAAAARALERGAGVFRAAFDALRAAAPGWCGSAEREIQRDAGDLTECVLAASGRVNASLVRAARGDSSVRAALDLLRNASGPRALLGAALGLGLAQQLLQLALPHLLDLPTRSSSSCADS